MASLKLRVYINTDVRRMLLKKMKIIIFTCYIFIQIFNVQVTNAAEIVSKKINNNFYVLLGGNGQGSHVGLSIGKNHLVLIDAMMEGSSSKLLESIRNISDKPIRYVVNTHDHFDHSGGNTFFVEMGATIISHENSQYDQPSNLLKFDNKFSLSGNTENIEVFHVDSHSSSDSIIYLKESNVILMGDVFANEWYPALFHGGISGQIKALDLALSFSNENTVIVPGHGYITNRKGLLDYKENSILWVNRIMELHKSGMSLEQIVKDEKLKKIQMKFNTRNKNPSNLNKWFKELVKNTINVENSITM